MGSVSGFLKLFRGSSSQQTPEADSRSPRVTRRSSGLNEFQRGIAGKENLCILDIGPTSPANIQLLTGLGHKVYTEDLLLASKDPGLYSKDEQGNSVVDDSRFLSDNLAYDPQTFDAVLCWDMADFMEEALVKPVISRIWSIMRPGGLVLGFFHTKDAGAEAPCYRYHIAGQDTLELQPLSVAAANAARGGNPRVPAYRLQRVFNNRHIENLFRDFSSIKFFLARDNVREVLVVR
jgi:hypothetical protein